MRYFIDTEFNERGLQHPIELISIGVVAEDGREFYRENERTRNMTTTRWIVNNVFPHLEMFKEDGERVESSLAGIADAFSRFIGNDPGVEFWGYYCAYDYVLISQIMGGMDSWPKQWPYFMYDLRQWLDHEALHHIDQSEDVHNALLDARWIRDTFEEHHWSKE